MIRPGDIGLANKMSLLRILLVPVLVILLFFFNQDRIYLQKFIVAVFSIAVITDFMDGLYARMKKEKTEFGKLIDPMADKFLLMNAFFWIYYLRGSLPLKFQIPFWIIIIIIGRDLLLGSCFTFFYYFKRIKFPVIPSVWGKLTTFFQMSTVLGVLINFEFSPVMWNLAGIFTMISGLGYVSRGVRSFKGCISD